MTLTLAPAEPGTFLNIRILNADRTQFSRRLEDQFLGQVVCALGTVQKGDVGFEVAVPDPTRVEVDMAFAVK